VINVVGLGKYCQQRTAEADRSHSFSVTQLVLVFCNVMSCRSN